MKNRRRFSQRTGFTLIELVMVLVIITALAALIIPVIDYIRRTSNKASASFAIAQVAENIAMYRMLNGVYPGGMDLLLEGDGTAAATDGSANSNMKLSSKITGKTIVVDLSSGNALDKTDDLIPNVMQHAAGGYRNWPGNSGVNRVATRSLQTHFRVIVDNNILESIYPGCATNTANSAVYPNKASNFATTGAINIGPGLLPGVTHRTAQIILLGIGPQCDAVGKTMVSPPAYAAMNGIEVYNRFLAMFAVYDGFTGDKRPQLVGALDSTMDFLNQEVIEVFENVIE